MSKLKHEKLDSISYQRERSSLTNLKCIITHVFKTPLNATSCLALPTWQEEPKSRSIQHHHVVFAVLYHVIPLRLDHEYLHRQYVSERGPRDCTMRYGVKNN